MNKERKRIIAENEISELYTFTLGGVPQKVLIEGKTRDLPVVITLHGGPGSPVPFSEGCRGMFPQFTDRFIMVYWDQLGCGINDCREMDSYGISDFVKMTNDLISEIKKLFPNNKIIIFGMSWGSVLALSCANNVNAVVVWGQVLHNLFLNDIVYKALEESELPKDKLDKIRKAKADAITYDDMKLISGSIRKYTNGYTNRNGEKVPVGTVIKGLLTSPDYSFKDFKAIMVNGTASSIRIWRELLQINLMEEFKNIQVPYYILQGETDIVTPTEYVVAAMEDAKNQNIKLQIVKKSGHLTGKEGLQAVLDTLRTAAGAQE